MLAPSAAAIARLIDAAVALAGAGAPVADVDRGVAATAALLRATLTPVALDQVVTIGERICGPGRTSEVLAAAWWAATELTAARAALAVADVARVVDRLEADGAPRERVLDALWSNVTDDLDEVRRGLAASPAGARR